MVKRSKATLHQTTFLRPILSYIYTWEKNKQKKKHEFYSSLISDHCPSRFCSLSTQKMLRILKGHIICIINFLLGILFFLLFSQSLQTVAACWLETIMGYYAIWLYSKVFLLNSLQFWHKRWALRTLVRVTLVHAVLEEKK